MHNSCKSRYITIRFNYQTFQWNYMTLKLLLDLPFNRYHEQVKRILYDLEILVSEFGCVIHKKRIYVFILIV